MTMWSEQERVSLLETREDSPQMTLYGYSVRLVLILVNPKVKIEGAALKLVSVGCCLNCEPGKHQIILLQKIIQNVICQIMLTFPSH